MNHFQQTFYARPARAVAQALLGQRLVLVEHGQRLEARIVESEAYCDSVEPDLACHGTANKGRPTKRTAVMFGPAGHIYMYFTYGVHWMFNIVTGQPNQANAILIRAVEPIEGIESMRQRRGKRSLQQLTNGPAKLTQAFGLDGSLNGATLFEPNGVIWIEPDLTISAEQIQSGPRVGLGKVPEPWFSMPWRYWIKENRYVSKYR